MLPGWHEWIVSWGEPGAIGAVIFRVLFSLIILAAAVDPLIRLGDARAWRKGTLGAAVGPHVVRPCFRLALAVLLVLSAAAFCLDVAGVAGLMILAAAFIFVAVVYLSLPYSGYVTANEKGELNFHIHHHLHLAGLAVLAMSGAAVAAAAAGQAAEPARLTSWTAYALWGAVASHYFVSGLTKLKRRGLQWPDRRFLPFYLTMMARYAAGDGEQPRIGGVRQVLMRSAASGVTLLWGAFLLELSTPLILFGFWLRLIIATCLVLFHMAIRFLMWIDFRENAMIAALTVLPFP